MNVILFCIAGMQVLDTLLLVAIIGKPRKPVTPGIAVFSVLYGGLMTTALIIAGLRLS